MFIITISMCLCMLYAIAKHQTNSFTTVNLAHTTYSLYLRENKHNFFVASGCNKMWMTEQC